MEQTKTKPKKKLPTKRYKEPAQRAQLEPKIKQANGAKETQFQKTSPPKKLHVNDKSIVVPATGITILHDSYYYLRQLIHSSIPHM